MLKVMLYSRKDCHLCDEVKAELNSLVTEIPHQLEEIDIDSDAGAQKEYGNLVPVVVVGPYQLKAPINLQDLQITLRAAEHGQAQDHAIDQAIAQGEYPGGNTWSAADRFSYWLSKHYMAVLNVIVLIYVGIPILAPVLMKVGATAPATMIYKVYSGMCHQLAFRSWFLFGEQAAYPRAAAGVNGLTTFEQATGINTQDLYSARQFIGDPTLGYKMALCERDIAIYLSILAFGLIYVLTGRKIRSIHWMLWVLIALVPIGLDGVSQLISQPPFSLIPYRESTPFLRTLTGFLFGFTTAWFGYPLVESSMVDTRNFMEAKWHRVKNLVKTA
jgi:uncharacterized membrane protein